MKLTVIGSSGSVPGPGNPGSCYLVSSEGFHLLLDCGTGAYGELQRYLDPAEVSAVALSHLHPDHCLDLCAFYVAGRHAPTAPWPRLPVYGPPGTLRRIARAHDVATPSTPATDLDAQTPIRNLGARFSFHSWESEHSVGPFRITTVRTEHSVPCWAIRVKDATGTLTYTGDTGPCDALAQLAANTDLLLCEAGFGIQPDPPPGIHLTAAQAAALAVRARAGQLLLTHLAPWDDPEQALAEAERACAIPVALASPGAVWTP